MSPSALRMIGDLSLDDRRCLRNALLCLFAGIMICSFSSPIVFLPFAETPWGSLWWIGAITFATGIAFIVKTGDTNRVRNSMYSVLFHDHLVSAKNIPLQGLWWMVCAGRRIEYSEELFASLVAEWERVLSDSDENIMFCPVNLLNILKQADVCGLSYELDAIAAGVPAEDVLA